MTHSHGFEEWSLSLRDRVGDKSASLSFAQIKERSHIGVDVMGDRLDGELLLCRTLGPHECS